FTGGANLQTEIQVYLLRYIDVHTLLLLSLEPLSFGRHVISAGLNERYCEISVVIRLCGVGLLRAASNNRGIGDHCARRVCHSTDDKTTIFLAPHCRPEQKAKKKQP